QEGDDRQARRADRPGRGSRGRGGLLARVVLRSLFLRGAGAQVVRADRADSGRSVDQADGRAGEETPYGAGGALVRGRIAWRLLQLGGRDRRGWLLSRQVPQDAYSALRPRLLGEVLLSARQSRLPRVRDTCRQDRPLHLLRPALPGGSSLPGI